MTEDLTTPEGVLAYIKQATSEADWNNRCDTVKKANGNDYPPFWFATMILSGEANKILGSFGSSADLRISSFEEVFDACSNR